MTNASETQSQTEQPPSAAPGRKSSRKSIVALSVLALAINGTAAIYTMPSLDIPLPDVSRLADLIPQRAPAPIPEPIVTALKDIQSAQQQHEASIHEDGSLLLQNTVLLQQDSTILLGLRQSLTDEQVDIKKISVQLSKLMAKVDSLQNAIAPEITSSIPKGRARNRLSTVAHKRWARSKPVGPVSVGGAPLTTAPAQTSPEG